MEVKNVLVFMGEGRIEFSKVDTLSLNVLHPFGGPDAVHKFKSGVGFASK